jgi:surface antigen
MLRALLLTVALVLAVGRLPASGQPILDPLGARLLPDELTRDDIAALTAAAMKLYTADPAAVGAVESWSNPTSGHSGTVMLVRTFEHDGMPCREVRHRLKLKQGEQVYAFSRCRVASGEWKLLG